MIGWVPHVLVSFLDEVGGPDLRRHVLADAGLDAEATRFALHTDVPDPACRQMIEAACRRLGVSEETAFNLFAPYFLARAKSAFPGFFRGIQCTRDLLLRQPAIHNSLATGLLDRERRAVADKFRVEPVPNGVRVHYNSQNRLACLYVAVARELAKTYREAASITVETGSMHEASCTLLIELSPLAAAAGDFVHGEAAALAG